MIDYHVFLPIPMYVCLSYTNGSLSEAQAKPSPQAQEAKPAPPPPRTVPAAVPVDAARSPNAATIGVSFTEWAASQVGKDAFAGKGMFTLCC